MATASKITVNVYNNSDNKQSVHFVNSDGTDAFDFSNVTRMVVILPNVSPAPITLDTDVVNDVLDWSQGVSTVILNAGGEGLPVGSHKSKWIYYEPANPDGIVMAHEDEKEHQITVRVYD